MTVKGRNRPRMPQTANVGRPVQTPRAMLDPYPAAPQTGFGGAMLGPREVANFRAYQQPQAPTMPMSGTYALPAPQTGLGPPVQRTPIQLPFYNKNPGMQAPIKLPKRNPRPRTQRMPTTLPTRRPQGQFMMDRQGRPVRTVPFINKTGRG